MKLVIGGAYQGKKEYVRNKYHIEEARIWQGGYPVPDGEWQCINGLHNIIRQTLQSNVYQESQQEILAYVRGLINKIPDIIIIADEVGCGIVPMEKGEREYRECAGRILCELAKEADTVERVHCGIGQVIKQTVYISLIRHGSTAGNLEGRYVGRTDELLCDKGREELQKRKGQGVYYIKESGVLPVEAVVTSPMRRCVETAEILYPDITPVIIKEFTETDFGLFEGKNYEELMQDKKLAPLYQAWIDGEGKTPFPEGESLEQMRRRCAAAFEKLLPMLARSRHTALVVHGGTIMSIMSSFVTPKEEYYACQCANAEGYLCRLELTGDMALYQMGCILRIL